MEKHLRMIDVLYVLLVFNMSCLGMYQVFRFFIL